MKHMTILNVAYPFAPVKPDTAGGAEQVVRLLDEMLMSLGHRSIIQARKGSRVRGTLITSPSVKGIITDAVRKSIYKKYSSLLCETLGTFRVDLVHMHGIDFNEYLPNINLPVLVTLHLPISWYAGMAFATGRRNLFFNCVSRTQERTCPGVGTLMPFVANGVDLGPDPACINKDNYAMCLGRICPEKGFHIAIEAAALARIPLMIAGTVFPFETHMRYFDQHIHPNLDNKQCRFIGKIGPERKRRLLSKAKCLLVPSLAEETSSLVAMESFACGTPVIAFRNGALMEIVENGVNGFLVSSAAEMAEAIRNIDSIQCWKCREVAERKYSKERMAKEYLLLYERILSICNKEEAPAVA